MLMPSDYKPPKRVDPEEFFDSVMGPLLKKPRGEIMKGDDCYQMPNTHQRQNFFKKRDQSLK
jgi:hypothetical protein